MPDKTTWDEAADGSGPDPAGSQVGSQWQVWNEGLAVLSGVFQDPSQKAPAVISKPVFLAICHT